MNARLLMVLLLAAIVPVAPAPAFGQTGPGTGDLPPRAIRRDIPHTNMIRRAYEAGTRDTSGRPGPNYWQTWMDYTIEAHLDPATSTVAGKQSAVIHNNSDSEMNTIQLRLDQNIFAANVLRSSLSPDITEGMTVTRLAMNGDEVDLNPPPRFGRGRRGGGGAARPQVQLAAYGLDQTTATITLPEPIPAHGTGTLEADWSFRVPLIESGRGIRMGRWADSLFQVAQWYPRVAVYDDLRAGGWDTEPYLGSSEFYNNFGRFDVTIDVPAGWVVAATGVLENPEEVLTSTAQERLTHVLESDEIQTIVGADEFGPGQATASGDRLQWRFVAESVGDFAWATSDRFVWKTTRAMIPERGAIPVHILHVPENADEYDAAGLSVSHALEFYSGLWTPYAFPQMTIVDGPESGMEYPMFTMSGLGAADHETGHEWWPMMVGTNETWYGFMDEGFNQYMNILSRADAQGVPPNLDGLGQRYGRTSGDENEAPLMWNANYGGPMYRFQAYSKAPLMLSMLGGIVGDSTVWEAMSDYSEAWLFKHPSPWDYAYFMNNALGQDLSWFWYYWLFTTESVDGSIEGVSMAGNRTNVTVRQDGGMPSPVVLRVEFAPDGPAITPMENSVMEAPLSAIVTYPVDVWFSGDRTFEAELDFGPRRIERIILDPRGRFPDRDPSDNMWSR
jgi:hypothetical protein